jgi:hypothetical protein
MPEPAYTPPQPKEIERRVSRLRPAPTKPQLAKKLPQKRQTPRQDTSPTPAESAPAPPETSTLLPEVPEEATVTTPDPPVTARADPQYIPPPQGTPAPAAPAKPEGKTATPGKKPGTAPESTRDLDFEYAQSLAEQNYNDGLVFLDMDHYALHGTHSTMAISVPGSDVCIEGDQLRSKEPMQFTDMTTDWSSCRWDLIAEDLEKVHCPDSAHKTKMLFDGYLRSPISYNVNVCLEYDNSNCYLKGLGTARETEVCRVDFKYEGIWAEGTIFDYRCSKSELRNFRHPLEYTIRYMQDVDPIDGPRFKPRRLHMVTRRISRCS